MSDQREKGEQLANVDMLAKPLYSSTQELALRDRGMEETGMIPYSQNFQNTVMRTEYSKKKFGQIVDFQSFDKHKYLTDNEFKYFKRVGNPIEYSECVYKDLVPPVKKKQQKHSKMRNSVEYITISKNVKKLVYLDCDALRQWKLNYLLS